MCSTKSNAPQLVAVWTRKVRERMLASLSPRCAKRESEFVERALESFIFVEVTFQNRN